MSARALTEHLGYWQDKVKLAAYTAALEEVIKPGDRVLDLGAGTGLLGMLAVRAGAGKVYSVDSGDILGAARDLAVANGMADRMEFIQGTSTDIVLPEVDVVVCDQIGGLAFDAGVLEYFQDARSRALAPGGTLIPAAFELFLVPVEAYGPYEQVSGWDEEIIGFDLEPMRKLAANTEFRTIPEEITPLSVGASIATLKSDTAEPIRATAEWRATREGTIHGLSGWFEAIMSPSVSLTNDPLSAERMNRWLNFYPLTDPVEVASGDTITASIDIRPASHLVTWSVATSGRNVQRMSTFHGKFVHDASAAIGAGSGDTAPTDRHVLLAELIGQSKAGASLQDLITVATNAGVLPTSEAAARFTRDVHRLLYGK